MTPATGPHNGIRLAVMLPLAVPEKTFAVRSVFPTAAQGFLLAFSATGSVWRFLPLAVAKNIRFSLYFSTAHLHRLHLLCHRQRLAVQPPTSQLSRYRQISPPTDKENFAPPAQGKSSSSFSNEQLLKASKM